MEKGKHGKNDLTFDKLDYVGQSRVINAQIQILVKSIKAHTRRAEKEKLLGKKNRDGKKTLQKCIDLLNNAITKL